MKQLSTQEQRFKEYLEANNIQLFSATTEEALKKEIALFKQFAGELAVPYQEISVKVRDGFPVRVRIFNSELEGDTLFYLPGNGYNVPHIFDSNTAVASRIAKALQQRVVIIDYRLIPLCSLPTPIQDAQDVINACVHDNAIPNVKPDSILLAGMSSGAHACAMLALDQKRGFNIKKLVLIAGVYNFTRAKSNFLADEALDYLATRSGLYSLIDSWNLNAEDIKKYSPVLATDFSNFPDTTIIVGEFDGIRNDSEELYLKLKECQVKVTKKTLPGQTHNNCIFYRMCGDENDVALECAKSLK